MSRVPLHFPNPRINERISSSSIAVVCQTSHCSYSIWKKSRQTYWIQLNSLLKLEWGKKNWQWKSGKIFRQKRSGGFCFPINLIKAQISLCSRRVWVKCCVWFSKTNTKMIFANRKIFVFTVKPSANIMFSPPQICVTSSTGSNKMYLFPENPFKKIISEWVDFGCYPTFFHTLLTWLLTDGI